MKTTYTFLRKLAQLIVSIVVMSVLVSYIAAPALAACGPKVDGLCIAPTSTACPLEELCCAELSQCGIDPGNLKPVADDPTFTPQGIRDEVSGKIDLNAGLDSPGAILSALLPYLFVFAGLVLLIMLIWGGFEMLSGATNPKSNENGKNRITAALKGFLLLFVSIWIAQLAQTILGINILNN